MQPLPTARGALGRVLAPAAVLSKQPGWASKTRASAPFSCLSAGKRQPISERAELDRNTDSAISIAGSPKTSIAEAWIERLPRRFDSAVDRLGFVVPVGPFPSQA